jgi:hypothetical protein
VEEGNTFEKLSETLESIVQILLRAQEYTVLFSEYTGPSTAGVLSRMRDNLTQLYAQVLNFLVRATLFVKKRAISKTYIPLIRESFSFVHRAILNSSLTPFRCKIQADIRTNGMV